MSPCIALCFTASQSYLVDYLNHFDYFRPLCPESGVAISWSQTRRTQTRRRRTRTRRTRWTAPGTGSPGTRGSNCDENIALILACTPPSSHYSASIKYLPSTIYYPFTSYQKTRKWTASFMLIVPAPHCAPDLNLCRSVEYFLQWMFLQYYEFLYTLMLNINTNIQNIYKEFFASAELFKTITPPHVVTKLLTR